MITSWFGHPPKNLIGFQTAMVAAKAAGLTDEALIKFEVRPKLMELDFNLLGAAVDAKGRYAVAWGRKKDWKVAVIDLETEKILSKKRCLRVLNRR